MNGQTVYYAYYVDEENGTVSFDFASRSALSAAVAEAVFAYDEAEGILTAGNTSTALSAVVKEENDDLAAYDLPAADALLGYNVTASVNGGHGTVSSPLAIEKDHEFTLQANVEAVELLMTNGATYLEVITAQQALLSSQLTKVGDDFNKMQAVVNLYYALGGGQ